MDTDPNPAIKDLEFSSQSSLTQEIIIQPIDTGSPNINDKKPRARPGSEIIQTTPTNKVARLTPRATRSSQNPDFAAKQRKFLNRVHDPIRSNNSDSENSQGSPVVMRGAKENKSKSVERKTPVSSDFKKRYDKESTPKRPADSDEEGSNKKKKTKEPTKVVGGVDSYCWRCHRDGVVIRCDCAPCPRVYHVKCVQLDKPPDHPWMCPECSLVTHSEDTDTRSRAMRMLTLDQLCNLLRFALNRMKNHEGAEDFSKPVDSVQFPLYREYIVKPMDLSQLERNIRTRLYGSTEAFLADAKWIVHNSIIFNSVQSKFTNTARALLKLCRQEMQHIENCPDCYQNSHTRSSDSWFTEACRRPHILVWAKLKGFPFWPAKVMSVNTDNNQVDVRFFGAHDRAWIPLNQCYLYSKLSPTPSSNNKNKRTLEECLQEVEYHIKRLRDRFGQFEYAPYKTPYDPTNEDAQLLMMLPQYESKTLGKRSRLSLHHDGARKSLGRRTTSPKHSSPDKPAVEETPAPPDQTAAANGVPETDESSKKSPMVCIPKKNKRPASSSSPVKTPNRETSLKQGEDRTPTNKLNTSLSLKKTPLTAAAKKCFATEKICAQCKSRTTSINGDSLCSICSDEPEIYLKKKDGSHDPNSTVRGTVTVHRKRAIIGEGDQLDEEEIETSDSHIENAPAADRSEAGMSEETPGSDTEPIESPPTFLIHKGLNSNPPQPKKKGKIVDHLQEKLCTTVIEAIKTHMTPEEVRAIEQVKDVDSSPEKTAEADVAPAQNMMDTPVVMLHDLRNDKETIDAPPVVVLHDLRNDKETIDAPVVVQHDLRNDKETIDAPVVVQHELRNDKETMDVPVVVQHDLRNDKETMDEPVVVLHDLRNDKEMMDKLRESDANKVTLEITHSPAEAVSEVETDVSSCGDSDSVVVEERKKKKKNINKVVQNLKERKSSVDERSESSKKNNTNESNTLMLDDSVEDSSILIIDEGESSDSKKSSGGKSDKSRRKGIPAKVHSRSSTSTESSETENRLTKSRSVEVLDEASGHFRRSSGEKDRSVTITVVTEDGKPQKKASKEITSVNISKSVSLSVIKNSAGLEMECAESESDEVIVDSIKTIPPRPTARKTLPNPLRPPQLSSADKRPASVPPSGLSQHPPPLVSLKQTKLWGPTRTPLSPTTPPRTVLHAPVVKLPARADVGPAHAKLEEVVQKVVTFVRSTYEDMLKASSDTCSESVEAVKQTHQLEIERLRWQHKQEMAELKHNTDLVLMEVRASMETDKQRAILELKHKVENEKEQAILDTKRKQWCANCHKEAQLYCCWNTAYCSYDCQQEHWSSHMSDCRNKQPEEAAPPQPPVSVPAYPQVGYNS